jgi:heme O synthase-like polyprenyltransferase
VVLHIVLRPGTYQSSTTKNLATRRFNLHFVKPSAQYFTRHYRKDVDDLWKRGEERPVVPAGIHPDMFDLVLLAAERK